jgi:hypothetical protein
MPHENMRDEFEYQRALRDCEEKLAALPARLQAEFDEALEERREPFTIQPVTAIRADLVCQAIKAIKNVPKELTEIVKVQSRSCGRLGKEVVGLNSDQLAAILLAAGVKPKEPVIAQV